MSKSKSKRRCQHSGRRLRCEPLEDRRMLAVFMVDSITNDVPGDFNHDGSVDAADYTVWRDSLGSVVAPFTSGDATGDGVVDAADYSTFADHFGLLPISSPLVVNDLSDTDDGDLYNGVTTLREAINAANNDFAIDTITFDPLLSGGTIIVGDTESSFSRKPYEIYTNLIIDARMLEEGITLNANNGVSNKIFYVREEPAEGEEFLHGPTAETDLTLAGLTMVDGYSFARGGTIDFDSRGTLTLVESTIRGDLRLDTQRGGAIYSVGSVFLIDSVIEGTRAQFGGAIFAYADVTLTRSEIRDATAFPRIIASGYGGGIYTKQLVISGSPPTYTNTNVTLIDSSIVNSQAVRGGGIYTDGDVSLVRSHVDNNSSSLSGSRPLSYAAGILATSRSFYLGAEEGYKYSGYVTLVDSSVSGNIAETGGELRDGSGGAGIVADLDVTLLRSHVDNNTVLEGGDGGGIATEGRVLLTDSTVNGNTANRGGGIFANGLNEEEDYVPGTAAITLLDSEVNDNTSIRGGSGLHSQATISVHQSEVSGNETTSRFHTTESAGAIYLESSFADVFIEVVDSIVSHNQNNSFISSPPQPVIHAIYGDRVEILRSEVTDNMGGGVKAHSIIDSTISRNEGIGVVFVGDEPIIGSTISENRGGGIQAIVDLTIIDSVVRGNTSTYSGAGILASSGAFGNFPRDVFLLRSIVEGNQTFENEFRDVGRGAGVYARKFVAIGSTIRNNDTLGDGTEGGGIYATNDVFLYETTVSGNATYGSFAEGGGVYSEGTVVAVQSTLSGNRTLGTGSHGGGISALSLNAKQSTITDNHAEAADVSGGGVYSRGNPNQLVGTILAGNFAGAVGNDLFATGTPAVSYSLIGDTVGSGIDASTGTGNRLNVDTRLGPLADNGGPTQTHALLPGSLALDAGDLAIDLDTLIPNPGLFEDYTPVAGFDARLAPFARLADGGSGTVRIDIGAYEAQAAPQGMPGDYNRDGTVDLADFTLWRIGEGAVVSPLSGADGNGDGVVDLGDYRTWKTHYGHSYTPPVAAVAFLQASDEADSAFQSPNRQVVDEAFAINERDLLLVSISEDDTDEDDREQPFQGEPSETDEADDSLGLAFASLAD